MTTTALKKKIKSLVDAKTDNKALQRIHDLLTDPVLDEERKQALAERLDRAEEDFKAGRVLDANEARERLRASLQKHRAAQARSGKRA